MFNMYVSLPHNFKGTHMSRFVEMLEANSEPFSAQALVALLEQMVLRLEATEGCIELEFPFFIEKAAPIPLRRALCSAIDAPAEYSPAAIHRVNCKDRRYD